MFTTINNEFKKTLVFLMKDYDKLLIKLGKYGKKYNKCYLIMLYYTALQDIMMYEYIKEDELKSLKSTLDLINELRTKLIEMINILDDAKRNPNNYIVNNEEFINNENYLKSYINEYEDKTDEIINKRK